MKKWKVILVIVGFIFLIAMVTIALTSCGDVDSGLSKIGYNKQLLDLNYKYSNAYIKIGDDWKDVKIKSWNDYDGEQLQIVLEDDTVILVNSMNCILYEGTLPKGK